MSHKLTVLIILDYTDERLNAVVFDIKHDYDDNGQ